MATIPYAARELGVSAQTVSRWVRAKKVPAERNELGQWLLDLDDVPRALVEFSQFRSKARWAGNSAVERVPPEQSELVSENRYLREQLARALVIIDKLSEPEDALTP